jgi:hypothetical protein
MKILAILTALAGIVASNRCNPGPGDADVRGPAQTVAAWPWQSNLSDQ